MNHLDMYVDFQWKRIEGESLPYGESPLEAMIHREEMAQVSESISRLNQTELACLFLMEYSENSQSIAEVQNYLESFNGVKPSRYIVRRSRNNALKKIRNRLQTVYGWNR